LGVSVELRVDFLVEVFVTGIFILYEASFSPGVY
jgi:hypothetical protein